MNTYIGMLCIMLKIMSLNGDYMKILITNDDGINEEGIKKLVKIISQTNDVYVAAPEKKLHGIGSGVTFDRPIKVERCQMNLGEIAAFKIYGTPADCVILSKEFLVGNFDLLISGINDEPNIGDDVRFSGTLGACIEAAFSGISSFGVSLDYSYDKEKKMFDTAAEFSHCFVEFLKKNGIPEGVFLNVNVPNIEINKVKGVKFVPLGRRRYFDRVHKVKNPCNQELYWIWGKIIPHQNDDIIGLVLKKNYISITPLLADNTSYDFLKEMISKWKIVFPN